MATLVNHLNMHHAISSNQLNTFFLYLLRSNIYFLTLKAFSDVFSEGQNGDLNKSRNCIDFFLFSCSKFAVSQANSKLIPK